MSAPIKTLEKIKTVKALINTYFGAEFNYSQLIKHLKANKLHEMNFYYLYYSGAIEKKERGIYFKTIHYNKLSCQEIYDSAQAVLHRMRERKRLKNKNTEPSSNIVAVKQDLSIDSCVSFLKQHGYKVLKPINQYEEI